MKIKIKKIESLNNNDQLPSIKLMVSSKQQKLSLQKNNKRTFLLVTTYLLVFGVVTFTTILILFNSSTYFKDSTFPNANSSLWNDYYHQHEKNNKLIDLSKTVANFANNKNTITYNVENKADISYTNILNAIDNNLQNNGIEAINNNDDSNLIPTNFFNNIIYNPTVKFNVVENDNIPIDDFKFKIPEGYDSSKIYKLNFSTNDESERFGIVKANNNMNINIIVKNEVPININDIKLDVLNKTICVKNPTNVTINAIQDSLLPTIKNDFNLVLAKSLGCDVKDIKDEYYKINFIDGDKILNFTKEQTVNFTIDTLDVANKWNFHGSTDGKIKVINSFLNLNKEKGLLDAIEKTFLETKEGSKGIAVTLDNSKDSSNVDTLLTKEGVIVANNDVIKAVKPICATYFKNKFPNLDVSDNDYIISTNLSQKDDLFNLKKGKIINITIKGNGEDYKLQGALDNIEITVHGHNSNSIVAKTYNQPSGFKINGIHLPSKQDENILQDGSHYYSQDNLYNNWIGNDDSLWNKFNKESYSIVEDSFTGNINVVSTLDNTSTKNEKKVDVKNIKNDKIKNFYQLLKETKGIYLQTKVTRTTSDKQDRTLDEVKLIFVNSNFDQNKPENVENILYTIDLCANPGCSIRKDAAPLVFNAVTFNINYEQQS